MAEKMNGNIRGGWVPLKEYVDSRFDAICNEISKSERVLSVRLESMNEFRKAMTDQQAQFVTKEEYRLAHKPIEDAMVEFRDFSARHQGKASQNQLLFVSIISVIGMILGLIHLFRVVG